jgi:CRISPR/Cas system endoribonuclease Cas6 (RAMP superfamily)
LFPYLLIEIAPEFTSPTSFHSGGTNLPLPLPSLIFASSFAQRWTALGRHHADLGRVTAMLAAFAFFGGVGIKMAQGMGMVRCAVRWSAPHCGYWPPPRIPHPKLKNADLSNSNVGYKVVH